MIKRRITKVVTVGNIKIGGNNPITVQSMTKTDTRNVRNTVNEIKRLERAGCEIIRVAVKDEKAARALKAIKKKIKIPLVADIHFDYRLALLALKSGVDKIRINPGNIPGKKELEEIIKSAKAKKVPIRIGINSGSLKKVDDETKEKRNIFVDTALNYIKLFERQNFRDIIISLKSSSVPQTIECYRRLSVLCDYPFHLGVTAAGSYASGIIKSSIGIGSLLSEGIGDTIRVSLTGSPDLEVAAGRNILKTLGLRRFGPDIISCPTCGRCQVDLLKVVSDLERKLSSSRPIMAKQLTIAVMGCEVNGPGEAKEADIGIAFGQGAGMLFKKGKIIKRVNIKNAVRELIKEIG